MKLLNIHCINLDIRKDRKRIIDKQCKKYKINLNYFNTTLHENPKRGCLESHYSILKQNKDKPYVVILEDDILFMSNLNIPNPPNNWDMIYLGGTEKEVSKYNKDYNKATNVLSTCGYVIRNKCLNYVLNNLLSYENEIDLFYSLEIQQKFNCYILKNHLVKQYANYSNIENNFVDYSKTNTIQIDIPEYKIINDKFCLIEKENIILPKITIITPTRNRRNFFELSLYNFKNFNYPNELLEWIIINDEDADDIIDIIPQEDNIKYIKFNSKDKTIAEKRNYGCSIATGEYIVHMDDDDIYFKDSILTRIKTLITNNRECIGVSKFLCLYGKNTFTVNNISGPLCESSLMYSKKFWIERNYENKLKQGEGILFISQRENKCIQIPWYFVFIALTHTDNITKNLRKIENENLEIYNKLDLFYKNFIEKLN